jgi:predicted extracellular nuclease
VDGLNALLGAGTYAYIDTGTIGTDAIKVGLLYKPATLTPVGAYSILDSSDDPSFLDTKNRPSLAQTFQNPGGEKFTIVVNHFKSKGSSCSDVGDPDMNDGQGNCNITRTNAALALAHWISHDPTGSGDPDFLLLGDFNAYTMEDPVTSLENAGYANLTDTFGLANDYSYVFDGQSGSLDHAFASLALLTQVTDVAVWHINADEPIALDYNDDNQPALYHPDAYRAADHDPIMIAFSPSVRYRLTLPIINR